jgi:hypothetical protein
LIDFSRTLFELINPLLYFMMWLAPSNDQNLSLLELIAMKDIRNLESYMKILCLSNISEPIRDETEHLLWYLARFVAATVHLHPSQSSFNCKISKIGQSQQIEIIEKVCFCVTTKVDESEKRIYVTLSDTNNPVLCQDTFPLDSYFAFTLCEGLRREKSFRCIGTDDEAEFTAEIKKFPDQCSVIFVFYNPSRETDRELSQELMETLKADFGVDLASVCLSKCGGVRFVFGYHHAVSPLQIQFPADENSCQIKLMGKKNLSGEVLRIKK